MRPIDDGGPAFPVPDMTGGMSLRDYFAAKAMQSLIIAQIQVMSDEKPRSSDVVREAYMFADRMLAARTAVATGTTE